MGDDPLQDESAASVAERAANGEHMEADEAELFPLGSLDGDAITAQSLVKRGVPVEVTASLTRAEVPNTGGLFNPTKYGRALVTCLPSVAEYVPLRDDDASPQRVTGWKVRQTLRVTYVKPANDVAALIRDEFASLLASDAKAAAAVLEAMRDEASEVLAQPV
jgi:hypothetical protein